MSAKASLPWPLAVQPGTTGFRNDTTSGYGSKWVGAYVSRGSTNTRSWKPHIEFGFLVLLLLSSSIDVENFGLLPAVIFLMMTRNIKVIAAVQLLACLPSLYALRPSRLHAGDGLRSLTLFVRPTEAASLPSSHTDHTGRTGSGSFETISAALQHAHSTVSMLPPGQSFDNVHLLLLPGRHVQTSTLNIDSKGSWRHLDISADEPFTADVSGGVPVTGWTFNSTAGLWVAPLPSGVPSPTPPLHSLVCNGKRQTRARHPNVGSYLYWNDTFQGDFGRYAFVAAPGDVSSSWYDLTSVQMLVYFAWTASRQYVSAVHDANRTVVFANPSQDPIGQWPRSGASGARYWIDNLREGLDADGEWYFDAPAQQVLYHAPSTFDMNAQDCVLPVLTTVLSVVNQTGVSFTNITISDGDWICDASMTCDGQSTSWSPAAAVEVRNSTHVAFSDCEVRSVGLSGMWIHGGSSNVTVNHCYLHDLGDGAVRIGDMGGTGATHVTVSNNTITDGSQAFPSGTPVLIHQAGDVSIHHNLISNFSYTGVAAGWTWGYHNPGVTYNIDIGWNRIDTIARYELSDLAGVYTLGYQAGSRVHHNWISNVFSYDYGGCEY